MNRIVDTSSPARGTWIEMARLYGLTLTPESSPARGTWIEIHGEGGARIAARVVPRTGDVD